MATKFKPGIPDTFTLNVEPVRDLGDYLDEPPAPRLQRKVVEPPVAASVTPTVVTAPGSHPATPEMLPTAPPQRAAVVAATIPEPVVPASPPQPLLAVATVQTAPAVARPVETVTPPTFIAPEANADLLDREDRGGKARGPRREIGMTPETLRMSDELLDVVRSGSGQRDTKASELFHALVLLVYEVMDEIDPHSIPKRGRWGTPTARAYPLELKNAFLKALLREYGDGTGRSADSAA